MRLNASLARRPNARIRCQRLAIAGVLLTLACDPTGQMQLPDGPSELEVGITIYQHAGYGGTSAHLTEDVKHLGNVRGPCETTISGGPPAFHWDDCISSVRLAPGWRAVFYRDGDWNGDQLQVIQDIPNLTLARGDCDKGGFNDCVTSIHLIRPR